MRYTTRLYVAAGLVCVTSALLAGSASGSQLIDRNAARVRLEVSPDGRTALLTYRANGRLRRVLAWGAIDARPPSTTRRQTEFRLDYSGRRVRGFQNACRPYDGPALKWLVTACRAPDGSYWAVQAWKRLMRPGETATSSRRPVELRLSHWRGPIAQFAFKLDWAYRKYDHVYGRMTYRGRPVHGFESTPRGSPLDAYGRNVYLDTFNSSRGKGWRREAGFLTHRRTGAFCYLVHGKGQTYRATVVGPGVTPDVHWQSTAPGPYDRTRDLQANAEQLDLFAGSDFCRPN
jgi:hypothetical protein